MRSIKYSHYFALSQGISRVGSFDTQIVHPSDFSVANEWIRAKSKPVRKSFVDGLDVVFDCAQLNAAYTILYENRPVFTSYACATPSPGFMEDTLRLIRVGSPMYRSAVISSRDIEDDLFLLTTIYDSFPYPEVPRDWLDEVEGIEQLFASSWFLNVVPESYTDIYGVTSDADKIQKLVRAAEKTGDAESLFAVAEEYDRQCNAQEAFYWYYTAGKKGHPKAMEHLALLFTRQDAQLRNAVDAIDELGGRIPGARIFVLGDVRKALSTWFDHNETPKYVGEGWSEELVRRRKESWITYYGFAF